MVVTEDTFGIPAISRSRPALRPLAYDGVKEAKFNIRCVVQPIPFPFDIDAGFIGSKQW